MRLNGNFVTMVGLSNDESRLVPQSACGETLGSERIVKMF